MAIILPPIVPLPYSSRRLILFCHLDNFVYFCFCDWWLSHKVKKIFSLGRWIAESHNIVIAVWGWFHLIYDKRWLIMKKLRPE